MSRRQEHESSLDLLLDTICNMFGMVIFIAVLAAVIAGARGEKAIASSELVDLDPLLEEKQALLDTDQPESIQRLRQAESALATRLQHNENLAKMIQAASAQLDASDPDAERDTKQRLIATLKQDLQDAIAAERVPVRTPRRHVIRNRLPVQIVLTEGRFLIVNDWSSWHDLQRPVEERCTFWSTWNPAVVDTANSAFEDHGSCEYRGGNLLIERSIVLIPSGGPRLGVDDDLSKIERILDQLDPRAHYISFRVTPDSFDRFHDARRLVIDRGFEHNVEPITLDENFVFRDRIERGAAIGQ
ncbi:MAG: hypothetical protein MK100_05800 [Phycisphaerales bacterium]|nr:hypothetical protein [Phycisphaerales bacterium]